MSRCPHQAAPERLTGARQQGWRRTRRYDAPRASQQPAERYALARLDRNQHPRPYERQHRLCHRRHRHSPLHRPKGLTAGKVATGARPPWVRPRLESLLSHICIPSARSPSLACRICKCSRAFRWAAKARRSSRNSVRGPPFQAFLPAMALPSLVRGPVDFSHGRQVRTSDDCQALRSGVQEVAMLLLQ